MLTFGARVPAPKSTAALHAVLAPLRRCGAGSIALPLDCGCSSRRRRSPSAAPCSRGRRARWRAPRASAAAPRLSRARRPSSRRRLGHLDQRLTDRRQRRAHPAGDREVVEADDAEVLRDVQLRLTRGLVDAERLEVVAGDDRRRAVGARRSRRPMPIPSSTWNGPWLTRLASTGTPASSMAARNPSTRARLQRTLDGPPMTPIRRWPRPSR